MIEFAGLTGLIGELAHQRLIDADNRHEDVLDNLCFAEAAEAEMNLMEVVFHIVQLVLAGTDTTRALITNCVFRLLEQREQWEAVVADRSLLSTAVEESLRHDSPAQFMVRSVIDDVAVGGCRMEAGKKVYLSIQSANHDETAWGSDAHKYRADRPHATGHLAFGRGIHACIGAPSARIEAISAISALMHRFPNAVLAPEGPLGENTERGYSADSGAARAPAGPLERLDLTTPDPRCDHATAEQRGGGAVPTNKERGFACNR